LLLQNKPHQVDAIPIRVVVLITLSGFILQ